MGSAHWGCSACLGWGATRALGPCCTGCGVRWFDQAGSYGEVEVDETYLALTDRQTPILATGRKGSTTKVLVVIAVEMLRPKGFGRIRIRQIEHGDHEHLMPFIRASIRPGAVIHSDGSPAYRKLDDIGYGHRRTVHLGSDTPAHESMPGVHRDRKSVV